MPTSLALAMLKEGGCGTPPFSKISLRWLVSLKSVMSEACLVCTLSASQE